MTPTEIKLHALLKQIESDLQEETTSVADFDVLLQYARQGINFWGNCADMRDIGHASTPLGPSAFLRQMAGITNMERI